MTEIQRSIEILDALVGFDTTSRNSNLPLIAWIEDYLDRHGVAHERIPDRSGTKSNVWATIGPADKPGYILSGATDMKGFLACCLAAVPAMKAWALARPIHLAISYDEEVGCIGVRDMIARLKDAPAWPAGCFVGEPTSMAVVIGHKGKRSLRVTVRGQTCHSSLTPYGVNAVEYAARLIVKIRDMSERIAREGARDPLYDVPFTTGHTGVVSGGTALNIVPDACWFEFEFRNIAADDAGALVD